MKVNPPIPPITDQDAVLEVFTHKSIRLSPTNNEQFGDRERLADIGGKVFELAVTHALFSQRPMLSIEEINEERSAIVGAHERVKEWVDAYGLSARVRFAPEAKKEVSSPEEARFLLDAYIGAVYVNSGINPIEQWISRLINPEIPPQPSSFPPPVPQSGHHRITVSHFNEMATKKGCRIDFIQSPEGSAHQPSWTVRCIVDGLETSQGRGKNVKEAKEAAANNAWVAMGW